MPEPESPSWLVLAYQLPTTPSHLRVRVWRRLQQLGAAVLRNSMYVLPLSAEAREDFEWVRSEIVANKGQASLLVATVVDGHTEAELSGQFRSASATEYQQLGKETRALLKKWSSATRVIPKGTRLRTLQKVREKLAAAVARDYFGAPGREAAEAALNELQRQFDGGSAGTLDQPRLHARDFQRRVWLTRPRPGIDRMASAWLIRRFIASDARFVYAARAADGPPRAIPFDMTDVDFGHHGARCTFETLSARFDITAAAVAQIGEIVHDLDLKETRYGRPEGVAIGRIVEGLRSMTDDDSELLERGILVIEALFRSLDTTRGKVR